MAKRTKLTIKLPNEDSSVSSIITYGESVEEGMADNVATFPEPTPAPALFQLP